MNEVDRAAYGVWPARTVDLDGTWELIAGDCSLEELSSVRGDDIEVPGLWEAQGYLGLDGAAWYRRHIDVADAGGWWTLHFGAVMDDADIFLNGCHLGSHCGGFTPFQLDCTGLLRSQANELAVRVVDHPRGSPEHSRSAHGKQGWMNEVFPSPPSLYLDYGGIWQSARLEQHGPVRVSDCWANGDPDELVVEASLAGVAGAPVRVELSVLGRHMSCDIATPGTEARFGVGPTGRAELWSPAQPRLHEAVVTVYVGDRVSDRRVVRFGLRTVRVTTSSFELNGVPFEMRSALVQGFSARALYGPVTRAEAEAEVATAQSLGLNTLRLHIKAFDPVYLDVCDELGMLVHCDIPIAEPIAHDELGWDGALTERCVSAAVEQVRRDRGHPCIVLWSAMNELGAERLSVRQGPGYEGFARRIYREIRGTDPTRPVIENDWVEPGADYVFESSILTAHWYGRLTPRYMAELETKVKLSASGDRPLFLSEFGDWGLPDLGPRASAFWSYGDNLSQLIESTPWPASPDDFVAGTQRYQGLADRLQVELFRRTTGVIGWCLTELTDVPQEFNGLLDLLRRRKQPACDEVRLAAQPVSPIFVRSHWSVAVGEKLVGDLVVVNDGPAVEGAEVLARVADQEWCHKIDLPAYGRSAPRPVALPIAAAGDLQLDLEVRRGNEHLGENYYPVRALARRRLAVPVSVTGAAASSLEGLLIGAGATTTGTSRAKAGRDLLVVSEGSLNTQEASLLCGWLEAGGDALLLAQRSTGDLPLPVTLRLVDLATAWGSTPFIFTTSQPALTALPGCSVLATELLSTAPEIVFTKLGDGPFAAETAVGVLRPRPDPMIGTVVGRTAVLAGRLTVCQLPVTERAISGDPLCMALLDDVLRWAAGPLTAAHPSAPEHRFRGGAATSRPT
jgi:hypothetical protein